MNLIEREKNTHGFSIIFTFLIILSYFYVIYKNLSYVEKNEIKYLNKIYDDFKLIKRYERPLNQIQFVQGFSFISSDTILESSGLNGESKLMFLDSKTFNSKQQKKIDYKYFGEGSAMYINKKGEREIHYLTWINREVLVFDELFQYKKSYNLPQEMKEGWGVCYAQINGNKLFLATDGTENIFIINPEDWSMLEKHRIKGFNGLYLTRLNELEIYENSILVNRWMTDIIFKLDLNTFELVKTYDLSALVQEVQQSQYFKENQYDQNYCLNGIAYDAAEKRLLITGKKWPYVYEISLNK